MSRFVLPSTILISPIGKLGTPFEGMLSQAVSSTFHCSTRIQSLLQEVDFAYHAGREQYHSTAILEQAAWLLPQEYSKILLITGFDLFIPILTHVYGEAQLNGRACIISTYRLGQDLPAKDAERTYQRRLVKEAVHELGHTFNLRHCKEPECIMHYCRHISDVDHKSSLCRYCEYLLQENQRRQSRAE